MRVEQAIGLSVSLLVLVVLVGSSLLGSVAFLAVLVESGLGACRTYGPFLAQMTLTACTTAIERPLPSLALVTVAGTIVFARYRW